MNDLSQRQLELLDQFQFDKAKPWLLHGTKGAEMSGIFEPVSDLWNQIRRGHMPLSIVATIPPERCRPEQTSGYQIHRDKMYFTIRVNEMHLAKNRQWWSVYDPLVVVGAEFNHGQERVTIPTVVGPNLNRAGDPPALPGRQ